MSIQVKCIDVYGIKADLRKRGEKQALQLIKALEEALERQKELTNDAISALKQVSLKLNEKQS